jgi:signal transduction histidine kinase
MKSESDHPPRAWNVAGQVWACGGLALLVAGATLLLLGGSIEPMWRVLLASMLVLSGCLTTLGYRQARAGTALKKSPTGPQPHLPLDRIGMPAWEQDWSAVMARPDPFATGRPGLDEADRAALVGLARKIRTLAANRAAENFVADHWSDAEAPLLLPPLEDAVTLAAVRALVSGQRTFAAETEMTTEDGDPVHVVVMFSFPYERREDTSVLMTAIDISACRLNGAGGHRSEVSGVHARDPETLGILSTAVIDELCEHLTAVQLSGESTVRWLHRADPDMTEVRRSVENVLAANDRSAVIVRRARDFLRKSSSSLETLFLPLIVEETVLLLEHELSVAEIEHAVVIGHGLPPITADLASVQQVVIQLVVNAIAALKFEAERGGRITITVARHGGDEVMVAIEDTAAAFATMRSDDVSERPPSNLVIGEAKRLAACRATINAHGGRFRINRKPGAGSEISFTFPADGAVRDEAGALVFDMQNGKTPSNDGRVGRSDVAHTIGY